MQAFANFSKHAFVRIEQRTSLSYEEIAFILDRKLTVNVGKKPGIHRNHLLFYSIADDDFFVAIQDELMGTVVTILPLDYHANLAWKISQEDCFKARDIYLSYPKEDFNSERKYNNATAFIIKGHFLDEKEKQKTKTIAKIDSTLYNNNINKLVSEKSFYSKIKKFATKKGIDAKRMFGVSICLGKRGTPVLICLQ